MKNKIKFLTVFCLLIIVFQSTAQISVTEVDPLYNGMESPSISSPYSSELPSEQTLQWGGGDAPDPEGGDSSTSGEAPVGNGFLVLLFLTGIYALMRLRYRKENELNSEN